MSEYVINWQSQAAQGIPGKTNILLAEESTDSTSSSLVLTGRGLENYGEIQQENFLRLLENFASATPPSNPTVGQLWFKPESNSLYVLADSARITSEPEYRPVGSSVSWYRIPIDISGTVKIGSGAASNAARLNLNGGTDAGAGAQVVIQKAGSAIGYFGDSGILEADTSADLGIWATTGRALRIYTNGIERVRVNSSGAIGMYQQGTGQSNFGTSGQVLTSNGDAAPPTWTTVSAGGGGSVTSVELSGGSTGLTSSGGPITGSGTLTLGGTLAVAAGGTGTGTAFMAGSVVFAGESGVYAQSNSNFFWDATNLRLGIGTTTPANKLDVVGSISASKIIPTGGTVTGTGMYLSAPNTISISTNSTEAVRIDGAGNLTVRGATITTSVAFNELELGVTNNFIYLPETNTIGFSTNNVEAMRIAATGALGFAGANYGLSGQVLTSSGSGAPPTWTTVSSGGGAMGPTGPTGNDGAIGPTGPTGPAGNDGAIGPTGPTGPGSVTSIAISGGTTGLTTSGGPITGSGTITLGGTLAVAAGGTGQTTASAAFNALVPSQTGNSGKYLTTNGTTASWATVAGSGSEVSSLTVFQWVVGSDQATIGPSDRYCMFVGASGAQVWQVALPNPATSTGRLITLKADAAAGLRSYNSDFSNILQNIVGWTSGVGPSGLTADIITVDYNWVTLISNGTYWVPIMRGS
jgi:hypothetical protein